MSDPTFPRNPQEARDRNVRVYNARVARLLEYAKRSTQVFDPPMPVKLLLDAAMHRHMVYLRMGFKNANEFSVTVDMHVEDIVDPEHLVLIMSYMLRRGYILLYYEEDLADVNKTSLLFRES